MRPRDSVWRMHGCTHTHFSCCEIINVYAGATDMTCVEAASNAGMSDMDDMTEDSAAGATWG